MTLKIPLIIGILLTLSVIGVVGYYYVAPALASGDTGFSILSISNIDFLSNDATINGQAFVMNIVDGGGQYAVARTDVTPDMVQKQTVSDVTSKNTFTVKLESSDQVAQYKITRTATPIYSLTDKQVTSNPLQSVDYQCTTTFGTTNFFWAKREGITVHCLYKVTDAMLGDIQSYPDLNFNATFTVAKGTESYSKQISNTNIADGWIDNKNLVYVKWNGNLVSGEAPPQSTGRRAVYSYGINAWKVVDSDAISQYLAYQSVTTSDCINFGVAQCLSTFNAKETSALNTQKPLYSTGGTVAYTSGAENSGVVKLSLGKKFFYPSFTMRINANWVGVVVPVGIPKITSASSKCFQTGQDGIITVNVQNIGDSTGTFSYSAQCSQPVSSTSTVQRITLSAGQTSTVFIPLVGSTTSNQDVIAGCRVTAYDTNNANNIAYYNVDACVSPIILCTNGDISCDGLNIKKCVGTGWTVQEKCDYGCTTDISGTKCNPKPDDPEICSEWDIGCKLGQFLGGIWTWISGLLGDLAKYVLIGAGIVVGVWVLMQPMTWKIVKGVLGK